MDAYPDDLAIDRSANNKGMIITSLQPEVDKVFVWSDKARLTLSTSKCITAFFSLDCTEAAWQPSITIDGKRTFCNTLSIFLGVMYDRQLTFGEYVRKICQSMSGPIHLLRALVGTTWGWHILDRRLIYIAAVCSMLEYAALAVSYHHHQT